MNLTDWDSVSKKLRAKKKAQKEAIKGTLDEYELFNLLRQRQHDNEEIEIKPLKELEKIATKYFREKTKVKKTNKTYVCTNGINTHFSSVPEKRNEVVFEFSLVTTVNVRLFNWSPSKGTHLLYDPKIINPEISTSKKKTKYLKM